LFADETFADCGTGYAKPVYVVDLLLICCFAATSSRSQP